MKFISLLATGYSVVDYAYARTKGIPVANVPTYGTASVSQFSIALLLEICHHIGHHDASVHAGTWANCADWCYWDYPLIELEGKTMGIIGFGRIARALGMEILAYDLYPTDTGREIARYVDLDELFTRSDVITLHCNLTPENTGFINKETIAKIKNGVILINNARGQLIVEQDVADALNSWPRALLMRIAPSFIFAMFFGRPKPTSALRRSSSVTCISSSPCSLAYSLARSRMSSPW